MGNNLPSLYRIIVKSNPVREKSNQIDFANLMLDNRR